MGLGYFRGSNKDNLYNGTREKIVITGDSKIIPSTLVIRDSNGIVKTTSVVSTGDNVEVPNNCLVTLYRHYPNMNVYIIQITDGELADVGDATEFNKVGDYFQTQFAEDCNIEIKVI